MAAALFVACAAVAPSFAPPSPFAGSGCTCEGFCNYSCAINATRPRNVTFYRMTPPDVLGMADKNSGDAAGDASFVLERRTQLEYCRRDPTNQICKDIVINDTSNPDVVLAVDIEIDGQWGPYLFCNPLSVANPEGAWRCTPGINSSSAPADFPGGACSAAYTGYDKLCWAGNTTTVRNVSLDGCCAAAGASVQWSYNRTSRICKIVPPQPEPCSCERVFKAVGRMDTLATYTKLMGPQAKIDFSGKRALQQSLLQVVPRARAAAVRPVLVRVYATGLSNGALFLYQLAQDPRTAGRIAAVAP
eukprot:gene25858-3223_t